MNDFILGGGASLGLAICQLAEPGWPSLGFNLLVHHSWVATLDDSRSEDGALGRRTRLVCPQPTGNPGGSFPRRSASRS